MEKLYVIFASDPLDMEGGDYFVGLVDSTETAEAVVAKRNAVAEKEAKASFGDRWSRIAVNYYYEEAPVFTDEESFLSRLEVQAE